ncbi:hypothetical protein ACQZV8_15855, partial [Magnetococcales bacterium HHB-1]
MFRFRTWFILSLFLAGGFFWKDIQTKLQHFWEDVYFLEQTFDEKIYRSIAYVLDRNKKWTVFPLTIQDSLIRVTTVAYVPPKSVTGPDEHWQYALEYQLFDKKNQLISTNIYHFRTRLTLFRHHKTGRMLTLSFNLSGKYALADGRVMYLNTEGKPQPKTLKIRFHQADPIVQEVGVRVYMRRTIVEGKRLTSWHRLSRDNKEKLAQKTLYSPALLLDSERENLMRWRWR